MSRKSQKVVAAQVQQPEPDAEAAAARARILEAAFTAFTTNGYAAASTLEIATRARVSKRELYALVGNKQAMLRACIQSRAGRLQIPTDLPQPRDVEGLRQLLIAFGTRLLGEVSHPTVVAVFRLAIAEAVHAPEVAQALDSIGREATRGALRKIMSEASVVGLIAGRPMELAERFAALLWGDLMMALLLGVRQQPSHRELARRARDAAHSFLELHALR
jgi:AcrR family transcriptional regulator